jgi:hypothetical protein
MSSFNNNSNKKRLYNQIKFLNCNSNDDFLTQDLNKTENKSYNNIYNSINKYQNKDFTIKKKDLNLTHKEIIPEMNSLEQDVMKNFEKKPKTYINFLKD